MREPTDLDPRVVRELRRFADASLGDFDPDRVADQAVSRTSRSSAGLSAAAVGLAVVGLAVVVAVIGGVLRGRELAADSPSPSTAMAESPAPTAAPPSPDPRPSDAPTGEQALARFLAVMAEPDVTYRLATEMELEPDRSDGAAAAVIRHAFDVRGDDYAGVVHLTGHLYQAVGMNDFVELRVREDVVQLEDPHGALAEVPEPAGLSEPNPFVGRTSQDFVIVNEPGEGDVELDVIPWLWGDPLHPLLGLGLAAGPDVGPMSVVDHETRLIIGSDGVPHRLTSAWTFTNGDDPRQLQGTLEAEFLWFGLYVAINPLDGPYVSRPSSHEIRLGDGEEGWAPWFEVIPAGPTATLTVRVDRPENLPWGIEGAIDFLAVRDADGTLLFDRKVALRSPPADIVIPVGVITLAPYTRTCSGWCSVLDDAQVLCEVDGSVAAGERYELRITAADDGPARCRLEGIGG
jgi:hypothetical protein